MKPETILQALSETRPALLDEARETVSTNKRNLRPLRRIALVAAALILLAAAVYAGVSLVPAKVPATKSMHIRIDINFLYLIFPSPSDTYADRR